MQELTIDSVDGCPDWVRNHPVLQPWEEGRLKLESRVHSWRREYSPSVCDTVFADDCDESEMVFRRQLNCWVYHWKTAGEDVDGQLVAESIENGKGYMGGGDLGGNPLFDLVLALAVTRRHSKAAARFQDELFDDAKEHAARLAPVFSREDPLEWWTEFFDELGGFSGRPPKLDRYDGRVGLRRWVPIILWNFLRNLLRKRGRRKAKEGELPEEVRDVNQREIPMEQQEDFATLSAIFRSAYEKLTPEEATLLSLTYDEGLSNLEVAGLLAVNPGTATRRRQRAERRFRDLLLEEAERRSESLETLRDRVAAAGADFACVLFSVLENGDEEAGS